MLGSLVQKGLAAARPGTVVKYAATAPELAVTRLIEAHRNDLAEMERDARRIALWYERRGYPGTTAAAPTAAPPIARGYDGRERSQNERAVSAPAAADAIAEESSGKSAARQSIGTGHGQREWAPVGRTDFARASRSPAQLTNVSSRRSNRSQAIDSRRSRKRPTTPAPPTPTEPWAPRAAHRWNEGSRACARLFSWMRDAAEW